MQALAQGPLDAALLQLGLLSRSFERDPQQMLDAANEARREALLEQFSRSQRARELRQRMAVPGDGWLLAREVNQLWAAVAAQAPAPRYARALLDMVPALRDGQFIEAASYRWHPSLKPRLLAIVRDPGSHPGAAEAALRLLQQHGAADANLNLNPALAIANDSSADLMRRIVAAKIALAKLERAEDYSGVTNPNKASPSERLNILRVVAQLLAQAPGPRPERYWEGDWVLKKQAELVASLSRYGPAAQGDDLRISGRISALVLDTRARAYRNDKSYEKLYADQVSAARAWLPGEITALEALVQSPHAARWAQAWQASDGPYAALSALLNSKHESAELRVAAALVLARHNPSLFGLEAREVIRDSADLDFNFHYCSALLKAKLLPWPAQRRNLLALLREHLDKPAPSNELNAASANAARQVALVRLFESSTGQKVLPQVALAKASTSVTPVSDQAEAQRQSLRQNVALWGKALTWVERKQSS